MNKEQNMNKQSLTLKLELISRQASTLYHSIDTSEIRDLIDTLESLESTVSDWEMEANTIVSDIDAIVSTLEDDEPEQDDALPYNEDSVNTIKDQIRQVLNNVRDLALFEYIALKDLGTLRDTHLGMFWQALAMILLEVTWSDERLLKNFVAGGGHFDSVKDGE
jgi:hypothetical protein